ncbi:MAG: D-glycerate dehydrogenase [Dehalococcoidales bacterium]|nr:D-glycerate dehydrogenase [Dehalococcoidales bacterium]
MPNANVFVSRNIFPEALDKIEAAANVEVWPDLLPPSYEVLLEKTRNADGLLCMLSDKVDANLINSCPNLKVISTMAVGYDNIDIAAATARGIRVGNTPGVLTETTADLTFSLLMAAARRVVEADMYTRQGNWKTWGPMTLLGQDIHHATLGIIGLGRIGTEVARRARGFDMNILYYSRTRKSPEEEARLGLEYVDKMADLLSRSDFVSLHVPLTPETKGLIGAKEFAMMKPTAVFVNASRGTIVDQRALYEALDNGTIFSAAIDVTEVEPIPLEDPLLTLPNLVIAPHIGSASFPTRTIMSVMAADNLLAGLRGEIPPNCVNP